MGTVQILAYLAERLHVKVRTQVRSGLGSIRFPQVGNLSNINCLKNWKICFWSTFYIRHFSVQKVYLINMFILRKHKPKNFGYTRLHILAVLVVFFWRGFWLFCLKILSHKFSSLQIRYLLKWLHKITKCFLIHTIFGCFIFHQEDFS